MMKRIISVLLVLMIFVALFATFTTVNAENEKKIIANTNPVITASIGESVDLGEYLVNFDESGSAVKADWYGANGESVNSLEATEKGVTKLTAKNADKEMTVYFVCKEANETEYVLFEVDFSEYTNISELKQQGFTTNAADTYYKFQDGTLVMGGLDHDYVRLVLPEWLGDFGDYSVTTEIKMLETKDASRWFGLVYRIQNANGNQYPYYHMCAREKTTANSGIEFAERTASNNWNVASATAGSVASLKNGYNTLNVKAFGKNIQYNLNGEEELFVGDTIVGVKAPYYAKGTLGITMNFGTVSVKNIKVTVQEDVPERPVRILNLINNSHEENNLINPIANVERLDSKTAIETISSGNSAGSVLINAGEFEDLKEIFAKCIEKQVLPTVLLVSQDDVVKMNKAMNAYSMKDANAISTDEKLLKNIRTNKPTVRTGLIVDIPEEFDSVAADVLRRKIRSVPATFCVIKSEDATYNVVDELQELAVAVWVDVSSDPNTEEYKVEALKAITSGANGIISSSAKKLTETINTYLLKNAFTRTPVMIGHRGNPSQAPENSLSGFIKAYENGADVFEVDVEITKDGEIVIMHDNTINRTTNYTGTKTVNQMTLEEIKQYNLKALNGGSSNEKVPTLREVFEEFKDKDCKIFVEFKGGNINNIKTTCDLIKEYKMEHKVDVISFSSSFLTQTQAQIPGMATGYLHSPSGNGAMIEDVLESLYPSLETAQSLKSSINPSSGVINKLYTQAVADRGMTVWPWTYVASSNNNAFLSGCDGVTTDDMQWVTNMAKYITASDITVPIDENAFSELSAKAYTYGGKETTLSGNRLVVEVISGEGNIKIEDGKVSGVKEGEAFILLGFKTKTKDASDYVLYTQPIKITVKNPEPEEPKTNNEGPSINYFSIAIIVLTVIVIIAFYVSHKVKEKKNI